MPNMNPILIGIGQNSAYQTNLIIAQIIMNDMLLSPEEYFWIVQNDPQIKIGDVLTNIDLSLGSQSGGHYFYGQTADKSKNRYVVKDSVTVRNGYIFQIFQGVYYDDEDAFESHIHALESEKNEELIAQICHQLIEQL